MVLAYLTFCMFLEEQHAISVDSLFASKIIDRPDGHSMIGWPNGNGNLDWTSVTAMQSRVTCSPIKLRLRALGFKGEVYVHGAPLPLDGHSYQRFFLSALGV